MRRQACRTDRPRSPPATGHRPVPRPVPRPPAGPHGAASPPRTAGRQRCPRNLRPPRGPPPGRMERRIRRRRRTGNGPPATSAHHAVPRPACRTGFRCGEAPHRLGMDAVVLVADAAGLERQGCRARRSDGGLPRRPAAAGFPATRPPAWSGGSSAGGGSAAVPARVRSRRGTAGSASASGRPAVICPAGRPRGRVGRSAGWGLAMCTGHAGCRRTRGGHAGRPVCGLPRDADCRGRRRFLIPCIRRAAAASV
ncbi:hypothetical protein SUDANB13_06468 [Streptomyces sp. enrichment culture]